MLTADVSGLSTLEEFYKSIVDQQVAAHEPRYCDQHKAIQKYISSGDVYLELGTHQGATCAAAMVGPNRPSKVVTVDHNLGLFNPSRKVFETYADKNGIEFSALEMDSTDPRCATPCDVLLIDSLHKRPHLEKELTLHADNVRKYIILHDTTAKQQLWQCIEEFCGRINPWYVVRRNQHGVGYTIIGR